MTRIALAIVMLAAQVGAGIHAAAVRHERCAEHGETVHAVEHGHGAVAAPEPADSVDDSRSGGAADEDHDHCAVPLLRRDALTAFTVPAVITTAAMPSVPTTAPAPRAVVRALYRLAPKASPPVAA